MRAIGRVDVERVIKDVDIDTLQVSEFPVPCSISYVPGVGYVGV